MSKILKISTATALIMASSLSAIEFTPIGYKAISMGGAGVANAGSSMASYYNPALLAKAKNRVEVSIGAGIGAHDNGAGESAEKLDDNGFVDAYERLNEDITAGGDLAQLEKDKQTLIDSKSIILDMDGNSVVLNPDAYTSAQIFNYGFGVYVQAEGAANAVVDQTRTELIYGNDVDGYVNAQTSETYATDAEYKSSSMIYAVENGETYLVAQAINLVEIPLSYGHNLQTPAGDVSLGVSLKYMHGTTYYGHVKVDTSDDDTTDELSDSKKTSSTFGIDLGVLYEPKQVANLRVGLVGKNLNSPSFSVTDHSDYKLDPMIRIGASYDIFDYLEVALDADITKNKTIYPDFDTQYIGGGVNYHPKSWFNIRAGLMDNLVSSTEGIIFTGGAAIGPSFFQLDVSGQYASKSVTVDGNDYPSYSKVNIAFISRW